MVKFIAPIREKVNAIRNDENYLEEVMEKGRKSPQKCKSHDGTGQEGDGAELLLCISGNIRYSSANNGFNKIECWFMRIQYFYRCFKFLTCKIPIGE